MYKEQALYFFLLLLLTVGCQSGKRVPTRRPNTAIVKRTSIQDYNPQNSLQVADSERQVLPADISACNGNTLKNDAKATKHETKESKSFLDDLPSTVAKMIGKYTPEYIDKIEEKIAKQNVKSFDEECTLACKQATIGSLGPDCSLEALVQLHTTQRTLKGHGTEALPDLRSAISIKAKHVVSEYFIDQEPPDWSKLSPEERQKKIVEVIEAVKKPSREQLRKGIGVLDAIHIFIKDDRVKAEAKKTLAAYKNRLDELANASHESSSKTHAVAQAPPHTPL